MSVYYVFLFLLFQYTKIKVTGNVLAMQAHPRVTVEWAKTVHNIRFQFSMNRVPRVAIISFGRESIMRMQTLACIREECGSFREHAPLLYIIVEADLCSACQFRVNAGKPTPTVGNVKRLLICSS